MTTDQKIQLILAVFENAGLVIGLVGALFTAVVGFLGYYWKPKVPAVIAQSSAFHAFRNIFETALEAAAAKLMNEAKAVHAAYDREMALAAGDPDKIRAAEKKWDEETEKLAHRATYMAVDEVGHLAPEWVKDLYKMGRSLLEKVLPDVQELFSKRN